VRLALPFLTILVSGCAAITTSPSWVGGGLATTGPLTIEPDFPDTEPKPGKKNGPVEEIHARHILVMHDGSQAKPERVHRTREEALERAKECLRRLRAGADFTEMVEEYSDEPGAIERGGDLGAFRRETMVKGFSDAAFALKVGEVSEIVETAYGFHIIKRTK
jgi:peptidyl-prolyl cis-trans isomerase NIMA-interacting 1